MAPAPAPAGTSTGHESLRTVNAVAVALLAGLCCVVAVGAALDACRGRAAAKALCARCRVKWWVMGLGTASYCILIPGLVTTLFHYKISAMGGAHTWQEAEESTLSFIRMLASTGGWVGSVFVVLFAIAIPFAKIVMFVLGECWRNSGNPRRVADARRCVITLQLISKWACPDMFAYILLVFLIRGLSHPPMLDGEMRLDVGFTCYAIFCVGSTLSSLGIAVPSCQVAVSEENESAEQESESTQTPDRLSFLLDRFGAKGLLRLAALPLVLWPVLFVVGLLLPCMALRLDVNALVANGMIKPEWVDVVVNQLHLPDLAKADVSIWKCMCALVSWSGVGDMNMIIAFVMLAVFVVLAVAVDLVVMMTLLEGLREQIDGHTKLPGWFSPSRLMQCSCTLKKISMLDVLIAGVVVVVLCGSIYESKGLVLSLRWGLAFLVASEVCRYAVFGLVYVAAAAVPTASAPAPKQAGDGCRQEANAELGENAVV